MPLENNRYAQRFAQLKLRGEKAFIPFMLLGWPDSETCLETIQAMIDAGASALELGFPFSEPVADGPVIQSAIQETLAAGFRVTTGFEILATIRQRNPEIPIGVMAYYNTILSQGVEPFVQKLAGAGVDGLLVVDLPPELAHEVAPIAKSHHIAPIFIVSPLTSGQRLPLVLEHAEGFLYVVSRLGITGTEDRYDQQLEGLLQQLKDQTDLPTCVGFGISSPENAQKMVGMGADGVITGSKILQLIEETEPEHRAMAVRQFCEGMVRGLQ